MRVNAKDSNSQNSYTVFLLLICLVFVNVFCFFSPNNINVTLTQYSLLTTAQALSYFSKYSKSRASTETTQWLVRRLTEPTRDDTWVHVTWRDTTSASASHVKLMTVWQHVWQLSGSVTRHQSINPSIHPSIDLYSAKTEFLMRHSVY